MYEEGGKLIVVRSPRTDVKRARSAAKAHDVLCVARAARVGAPSHR